MPVNLGIDDEFSYCGVPYIVHSIDPPNISILRLDGDRKLITMDFISLISQPDFFVSDDIKKRVTKENDRRENKIKSQFDILPDDRKEKVIQKYEIIKPILLLEKLKLGDFVSSVMFNETYPEFIPVNKPSSSLSQNKLIELIETKHRKSKRTIKRYLSSFREVEMKSPTNGKDGLISKRHLGLIVRKDEYLLEIAHPKRKEIILDTIKLRLDKAYGLIIKEAIEKSYLTKRRPNISFLTEIIEIKCEEKNLEILGYDTIYKIVKRVNKKVVNILRIGDEAQEEYQLIERGFSRNAKTPLYIIEIDHTPLDMDIIDETSGVNIGRVWLTVGIDVFSREIWCMDIDTYAPSANKVRKAVKHGLFFKNAKEKYGTNNEWDICGIPQIIYVDNGSDFTSADVKRFINEGLNIQIMHRPVKLPHYGAIIERVLGTINRSFIQNLWGTRKSNPNELGEYDAEKEAIFTLENIRELLTTYIVDVYHHKVHKGLPLNYPTPAAMYYHGIDKFGYPDFVQKDEEEVYSLKLMAENERKYSKDGIRMNNVIYNSKETSRFITSPLTTYKIKYDWDDISFVYILDPKTGEFHKIYAQNPPADEIKGMSRRTYKLIFDELREQGKINIKLIPGSRDITRGKKLLKDKYEKMMKNNKRMRQEALKSGYKLTTTNVDVTKLSQGDKNASNKTMSLIEQLNYERSLGADTDE
jgi:putative transposase